MSGHAALQQMRTLSGGQKTRVVLTALALACPHVLLLDEPTNHLDLASVEALIEALQEFEGSVVLVAHDQHLIRSVAETIFRVDAGVVRRCDDLDAYLTELQAKPRRPRLAQRASKPAAASPTAKSSSVAHPTPKG